MSDFHSLGIIWSALTDAVLNPGDRIYWKYLLVNLLIGGGWASLTLSKTATLLDGLRSAFCRMGFSGQPIRVDASFTWLSLILQASLLARLTSDLTQSTAAKTHNLLAGEGLTYHLSPLLTDTLGYQVLETIALTLAIDFGFFLAHWLQHHLPFLWQFHSVHHSAKVLTAFTAYRQHPIDYWVNALCIGPIAGFMLGILQFIRGEPPHLFMIAGSTLPFVIFYIAGYHLRHSDLRIHYGVFLSHIFISPAQHQIHHSSRPEHRDRNLGYLFAMWDALASTLVIPQKKDEPPSYGLSSDSIPEGFLKLLLTPFQRLYNKNATVTIAGLGTLVTLSIFLLAPSAIESRAAIRSQPTLWMEEMTSPEVGERIRQGVTRVIIPSGGLEQNGAHLPTGKHNMIVRKNAERLAEQLGDTLIAPVIVYVPEGSIDPREGHMRYPGTISLHEKTFEALLEDIIKSLRAQGFTTFLLIGDSGGNQKVQQDVADLLNSEWKDPAFQVIPLSDYYRLAPQIHYLEAIGFSRGQIGEHAGVRDTSELEFNDPESVRASKFHEKSPHAASDGRPDLATPEIGKALTDLKVQAAYRQALGQNIKVK